MVAGTPVKVVSRNPVPGRGVRASAASAVSSLGLAEYPVVPTFVMLLFCSFVVEWYLQASYRVPALGAIRFELLFGILLAAIAVGTGAAISSPLTPVLIGLFICMAVQVPLSHAPAVSFDVFVDRVLKFFCMALFIVSFVKGPRQLRWFIGAFLLACLKMGQEGFLGMWTGSLMWQNQGVMRLHGPTPIYEHPNSFAGMAIGTFPFAFYLFPVGKRWVKITLIVLAVFSGSIVLFSGSRTAYMGCLGFVAFAIWRADRRFRAIAVLLLVGVIAIPLIPPQYAERFESIYTGQDKEGHSTNMRKEILSDAWEVFQTYPLGIGVGAFPTVRYEIFGRTQDTHNLYLEVATNLGIQGLVVFLAFVGMLLAMLSRLARDYTRQIDQLTAFESPPDTDGFSSHLADLRFMRQTAYAVQGFLVTRLVLGLFGMDLYEIYWWFAMGIAIALHKMSEVAESRTTALAAGVRAADKTDRSTTAAPFGRRMARSAGRSF